ncbi:hypothetical protein LSAT2_028065 [Lamellibrachia satsuma]|nr:hypothetical protein LSAT2_028065 [Lamellibrachia satsuma]
MRAKKRGIYMVEASSELNCIPVVASWAVRALWAVRCCRRQRVEGTLNATGERKRPGEESVVQLSSDSVGGGEGSDHSSDR